MREDIEKEFPLLNLAKKYHCCYDCLCDRIYGYFLIPEESGEKIAKELSQNGTCYTHHPEMKKIRVVTPNLGAVRVR